MRLTVCLWLLFAACAAGSPRPVGDLLAIPVRWQVPGGTATASVSTYLSLGGKVESLPFTAEERAALRQYTTSRVVHPLAMPCPPGR